MSEEGKDETEKSIFTAIETDNMLLLQTTLTFHPSVNIVDENLMTPLQHAAYKGNKEMVQLLLDNGAQPNLCKHQHNYTALHFAGLSGNHEVCLALLIAGAQSDVTNAVNRTPAQMAAFVGNHKCVAVINNFIQKAEVDYYVVARGLQTEGMLPTILAGSFHKFIIQVNMHPVKIALNLHNFMGLSEHLDRVRKVLDAMCEKEMKKETGRNEVKAFKLYYLGFVTNELLKLKEKEGGGEKKVDTLQLFCKCVLKPAKDDSLDILDCLLKECVKGFPHRECTIFRQMVSSLAIPDAPPALNVITAALNGQHGFTDVAVVCSTCGEDSPSKKCSQCKVAQYCDRECQRLHWHWHKKSCSKMKEEGLNSEKVVDAKEVSEGIQNLLVGK